MPNALMQMVARSVAASPLADDCVVVTREGAFATRATWVRRESEDSDDGIRLESAIRVPLADVDGVPVRDDGVQIDGRLMSVTYALVRGPVMEIGLTARNRRDAVGGRIARP